MRFLVLALLLFPGFAFPQSKVITACQDAEGKSYFSSGYMVKEPGWRDDGFSSFDDFVMLSESDGKLQIVFMDVDGKIVDPISDYGALVMVVPNHIKDKYILVVLYPAELVETYMFDLNATGNGKLLYTKSKAAGSFNYTSLFVGTCAR